jgi:hypothetical protein
MKMLHLNHQVNVIHQDIQNILFRESAISILFL